MNGCAGSLPCTADLAPEVQAALSLDSVVGQAAIEKWYAPELAEILANAPPAPPIPASNPEQASTEAGQTTVSG